MTGSIPKRHAFGPAQKYRLDQLIAHVASKYAISVDDMLGIRRVQHTSEARHVVGFAAYQMLDIGYQHIADALGHKDHTSIIHGIRRIELRMKTDDHLCSIVHSAKMYAAGLAEIDRLPEPVRPV